MKIRDITEYLRDPFVIIGLTFAMGFIGYVGYSLYRTENYRGPTIASRLEEITREMKKTAEIMEDTNAKLDTLNVILKRNYIRELERDLSTK